MTNASSDDNPFDRWRAEIRAFCTDIRQQLEALSAEIDALQPERAPANIPTAAVPNEEILSAPVSTARQPATQSDADTAVTATHSTATEPSPTPEGDRTEDRLHSVRLQLQAMLNSVNG